MILYLDISALIKRYVGETYSAELIDLVENADLVGTSVLTHVEMAAALAKATRQRWVQPEAAQQSWQDFLRHWPAYTRLNISTTLLDRASALAWGSGLRGYDAVHLASAMVWQDSIGTPVMLATFDRELWIAGEKERLSLWPEQL